MFDLLNLSKTVLICNDIRIDADICNIGDAQVEVGRMETKA